MIDLSYNDIFTKIKKKIDNRRIGSNYKESDANIVELE